MVAPHIKRRRLEAQRAAEEAARLQAEQVAAEEARVLAEEASREAAKASVAVDPKPKRAPRARKSSSKSKK